MIDNGQEASGMNADLPLIGASPTWVSLCRVLSGPDLAGQQWTTRQRLNGMLLQDN